MKRLLPIVTVLSLLVGCDQQRDLYGVSPPALYIEGDWRPTLSLDNMSQRATAILYNQSGMAAKEYFIRPNCVTARIPQSGEYKILLFNGLMYSPEETHLDQIYFCGTEQAETFEACAREAPANNRLTREDREFIASNDMELLTSLCKTAIITGESDYYLKYKNGKNGNTIPPNHVKDSLFMVPVAVSYEAQVMIQLVNPSSAGIANGALRGFAGSVFMESRLPSHAPVTHHLRFNNLRITNPGTPDDPDDPETGTIESPVFVTFGPPLDLSDRRYEFFLSIVLKDGTPFERTVDITDKMLPVIASINACRTGETPTSGRIFIPINLSFSLPKLLDNTGIGVNGWGDEEVIRVPIR